MRPPARLPGTRTPETRPPKPALPNLALRIPAPRNLHDFSGNGANLGAPPGVILTNFWCILFCGEFPGLWMGPPPPPWCWRGHHPHHPQKSQEKIICQQFLVCFGGGIGHRPGASLFGFKNSKISVTKNVDCPWDCI